MTERLKISGTAVANKLPTARPRRGAQPQNKKRRNKMNGLINLPKLGDVGSFCMIAVVAYSVSSLVYILASGFFGGGAA
jgi:hypothetical protein